MHSNALSKDTLILPILFRRSGNRFGVPKCSKIRALDWRRRADDWQDPDDLVSILISHNNGQHQTGSPVATATSA